MTDISMPFLPSINLNDHALISGNSQSLHGVVLLNQAGRIRSCNGVLQVWLGASMQTAIGRNIAAFLPGLMLPAAPLATMFSSDEWLAAIRSPKKLVLQCQDGRCFPVNVSLDVLSLDQECLFIGVIEHDQRKRSMEDFILSATLSPEAVAIIDDSGRFEFVNDAFEAMTGYRRDELIGLRLNDVLPEFGPINAKVSTPEELVSGERRKRISMRRRKNGDTFFFFQSSREFIEANSPSRHTIFEGRDITAAVMAQQNLSYRANYDQLTGLPSRASMLERLQESIWQAQCNKSRFAIAIIDIDEFKSINDRFGHSAGDAVLIAVAERIRSSIADAGAVGRLSGDEFLVILPDAESLSAAEKILAKIHDELSTKLFVKENPVTVTVSVGAALYPQHGCEQQSLLEYADFAMYREKSRRDPYGRSGRKTRRAVIGCRKTKKMLRESLIK